MAQIDIQGLFKDVLPNEVIEDKSEGVRAADLVGTLGGMAAYYGPQRERQLRRATGGLLGIDMRTEAEAAREELQKLGRPQTDEEHQKYADILDRVRPGSGVQYMLGIAQEQRDKQRADASTMSAEANMMNAQTSQAALPVELAARLREIDVRQGELELAGETQEDLVAWRKVQETQANREAAIKEEKNRVDLLIAETQAGALGAADKKAIREATAASREQTDLATRATNIANEYLALEPLSGFKALASEKWKELNGSEDEVTKLRTEFNQIKNNMVMESLPPGVASDKDIAIAMSGFPSATASPEYVAQYMRGMAKLAAITAERENLRAIHLAENKGIDQNFDAEWREIQAEEGWEQGIAQKYGLMWNPEKDEEGNVVNRPTQSDIAAAVEARQEVERRRQEQEQVETDALVQQQNEVLRQTRGYTL